MRKLWLALLFLALLAAALVTLVRSQSALLATLHWAMDRFTDYRLELKAPEIDLLRGVARADEVHLYQRGADRAPMVSVLDLDILSSMRDLWRNDLADTYIEAHALMIFVSDQDTTEDPQPLEWLRQLRWLPFQLDVEQVHLITESDNVFIFPLRNLTGRREGPNRYRLRSAAQYEGEPLELSIEMTMAEYQRDVARLEMGVEFYAPRSDSLVRLQGQLRGTQTDFNYDFVMHADYHDIGEFLSGLKNIPDIRGQLNIDGRMEGDQDGFTLTDANVTLDNLPAYGFQASGDIHRRRGESAILDLQASGEVGQLSYLSQWTGLDLARFGRAQANARITGPLDAPKLEDAIVYAVQDNGVTLAISGDLAPTSTTDAGNVLRLDISAPDLDALDLLSSPVEYDPGYWRASALLKGTGKVVSVEELVVEAGNYDSLQLRLEGQLDRLGDFANAGLAAPEGVNAVLKLLVPDTTALADIAPEWLPPHHQVRAELPLKGSKGVLTASGGLIEVRSSDLDVSVADIHASIQLAPEPALTGLQGQLSATLSDSSAVSQYIDWSAPSLGPVQVEGRLAQHQDRFALEQIEASLAGEKLAATARGSVADLEALDRLSARVEFSGVDTRDLLQDRLEAFSFSPTLGQLQGTLALDMSDGEWSAREITIDNRGSERLDLSIRGDAATDSGSYAINLSTGLKISDQALLQALTGLRLAPLSGALVTRHDGRGIAARLRSRIGATDIKGEGQVQFRDNRVAGLSALISSPSVSLADLGLQAEEDKASRYSPAESIKPIARKNDMGRLLKSAPRFPTDLRLELGNVRGEQTSIDRLDIHLTGADGQYTLRQLSSRYHDAEAEVRGIIDLNQDEPYLSLAGEAISLPMDSLMEDLGIDFDITGTLTARGGITAQGADLERLLATSNGSLSFALEKATIKGAAYDVLATDFIDWIVTGGALKNSTRLDCSMGAFDLRSGVARSDTLYVETRRMLATGEGRFDLPRRYMDMTITPLSKSRDLQIPASVRIRGDMAEPRIIPSPIAAVANVTTEALGLIPRLTFRLFGIKRNRGPRQPCEPVPSN